LIHEKERDRMQQENGMTARDFVNQILPAAIEMMKEKTKGISCILGLHLLGEGGGSWTLRIQDGITSIEEGNTDYWDCAISVPAQDYLALAAGKLSPYEAIAQRKIGISGNLGLTSRLRSLFKI